MFEHQRHKPANALARPRELVVVCAPLKSNVNLSRIVRAAGCCGVPKVIATGTPKVIDKIARDGAETVEIEVHRSLPPVLEKLRRDGFRLVGLEQTTNSQVLCDYEFLRKTALIVGNERNGLTPDALALVHNVVEIPVWGAPYSHNVATAASMALYEDCRQFPDG